AIDSAFAAGAAQVIVADGASEDHTREIAASRGATVLPCEAMRARQFNRGAAAANHETLIFLHADTTLPPGAAPAAAEALARGASFGGFRIQFAEPLRRLRFVAFMVNLRTRITRCPWGDQAQFIAKPRFLADGGFREIPLMEDYELAVRMKRSGVILPLTVTTSGRRFLEQGVIRTTITNWIIVAAWRLGVRAEVLAKCYRGSEVTSSSRGGPGRD
ncbi:MAG: TIGR04283 family arsenosugar biosynthesis glycosyltransferase, partial [Thermoanaerobaculia bacterium]